MEIVSIYVVIPLFHFYFEMKWQISLPFPDRNTTGRGPHVKLEHLHGKEIKLLIYTLMCQWDKTETTGCPCPVLCLICTVLIYVIIFLKSLVHFSKIRANFDNSITHKNRQQKHGILSKEDEHTNTLHTIYTEITFSDSMNHMKRVKWGINSGDSTSCGNRTTWSDTNVLDMQGIWNFRHLF
jgi:hypothetical protein